MRISPKLPYRFSSSKLPMSKIWKTSIFLFLFLSLFEAPLFLELYPVCWKTSSAELLPDGMGWHGSLQSIYVYIFWLLLEHQPQYLLPTYMTNWNGEFVWLVEFLSSACASSSSSVVSFRASVSAIIHIHPVFVLRPSVRPSIPSSTTFLMHSGLGASTKEMYVASNPDGQIVLRGKRKAADGQTTDRRAELHE